MRIFTHRLTEDLKIVKLYTITSTLSSTALVNLFFLEPAQISFVYITMVLGQHVACLRCVFTQALSEGGNRSASTVSVSVTNILVLFLKYMLYLKTNMYYF